MTLDYPYWYLTIRNITPIQWRDHDGREIAEIALSNLHFDDQAEPYLTGKFLNGGTAYYNLGLKISELIDSMSEQYFLNTLSNIGTLEFSMSRQWSDRFGTKSFRDLLSRIEFYSNAGFTILGSQVTLYLGNGTVPGYALSSGGFYWEKIGAGESVLWEPSKAYNVFDSYTRKFSGFISGKKTSKNEISFSCESRLSILDVMIGKPVAGGSSSSSEIEPICFGTTNRLPYTDRDASSAFPLAQIQGIDSVDFISGEMKNALISNIVTFDENTGEPYLADTSVIESIGNNSMISFSDYDGISMERTRGESEKWAASKTEIDSLIETSYTYVSSQKVVSDKGESISLHTKSYNGFSQPNYNNPTDPFDNSGSFDSRGWGDTKVIDHSIGTPYATQKRAESGVKIPFKISLPANDITALPYVTGSGVVRTYDNIAISGDLKKFVRGFYAGTNNEEERIFIGLTNYGPTEINGVPTGLIEENRTGKIRLVWRPARPDIDDNGSEDGTTSSSSDLVKNISVGYVDGVYAGTNPSFDNDMDASCEITYGCPRYRSYENEISGSADNPDATLFWRRMTVTNGDGYFETGSVVSKQIPIAPSTDFYLNPIDGVSFSSIWDSNLFLIDISLVSNFKVIGDFDPRHIAYNHAYATLIRLYATFYVDLDIKKRELYWIGQGIKRTDSALVANDGSNICTAIMKHFTGIDISTEDAEINLCGAISERVNLRDAMRSIASQSFSLLYEKDGGVYMRRLNGQYDRPFIITDSMLLVDNAGWIEVEGSETDISALYSSVEVMFRPDTQDRYMGCITIGAGYNKVWNEPSESVINYDFTDPVKWLHISSAEMNELSNICYSAEKIRGTVGSEKANKLSIKAPYIRTRADAEKYLSDLVKYSCVQLKKITMSVTIEASKDIDIGDTISFNLPPEHRDGYMYHSNLSTSRRFIVVKKSMMLDSEVAMCKINLVEIPYNSVLGYP